MVFGSEFLERMKLMRVDNSNFKENFRNFVGQCVKYDIMLNQKYSFDDLQNTNDLWGLITSNPSKNRGIFWIPLTGKGMATYVTCEGAVEKFNQAWAAELDRTSTILGRKFFTGRFIANSGSMTPKLTMNSSLETALKAEFKKNLQNITSYLGDMAGNAEETLKQALLINSLGDAASENSKLAGNAITYAETRALQQQSITFDTIGRLSAKLLPIMKAVIEALAYACFIFIIPLCMIPQGYKFLINWVAILVWLQAWVPMYAILNYIMNIAARASTISEIGTAGGLTIANYIGVSAANSEIKLLAGYLTMSIPFICIAIVKGVGSFIHLAGQMTGTSMQAANSAAAEVSSGNFSFGNVSMNNRQMDNLSQLQRNHSSSLSAGGHTLNTGGVQITNDANGFKSTSVAGDSAPVDYSATNTNTEELRASSNYHKQKAFEDSVNLSHARSASHNQIGSIAESVSHMKAEDIQQNYNQSAEQAKNVMGAARYVDSHSKGHVYADGTRGEGNFNVGAQVGGQINVSKGTGDKDVKQASAGVNLGVQGGGGLSTGVQSTNTTNHGDSQHGDQSKEYSDAVRTLENFAKNISTSDRNDDVTNIAKNHQHTLSEIDNLSKSQSFNESEARRYDEAHSKASSLSFSKRQSLMPEALEIARQERGYGEMEAANMLRSTDSRDQAEVDSWFKTAAGRQQTRMSPSMPHMKQPNWNDDGYSRQSTENKFESQYQQKEQTTQSAINEIDSKREGRAGSLQEKRSVTQSKVDHGIKQKESAITQKEPQIRNEIQKIEQEGKIRSSKGAAHAAKDKAWEAAKDSAYNLTGGIIGEKSE
jgi:conjugal transfer mating pair stabilization protein TraG